MVSKVLLSILKCLQLLGIVKLTAPAPVKPKPLLPPRLRLNDNIWDSTTNKGLLIEAIRYQARVGKLICDHCDHNVTSNFRIVQEGDQWYWKCPECSHPNNVGLKH